MELEAAAFPMAMLSSALPLALSPIAIALVPALEVVPMAILCFSEDALYPNAMASVFVVLAPEPMEMERIAFLSTEALYPIANASLALTPLEAPLLTTAPEPMASALLEA